VISAALKDRPLAVNDRHVGQRQLEDGLHQRQRRDVALVGTTELRTKPTHHLDVFVGDLLGCGLFHDGVLAHDVSRNVRPSDDNSTPLHCACQDGDGSALVGLLLDGGARPDVGGGRRGRTSLESLRCQR